MTTDDQIKNEKLQYVINRELQKYLPYHEAKLSMNILLVKKYYLSIKNK